MCLQQEMERPTTYTSYIVELFDKAEGIYTSIVTKTLIYTGWLENNSHKRANQLMQ
jgi:hypothetical protein